MAVPGRAATVGVSAGAGTRVAAAAGAGVDAEPGPGAGVSAATGARRHRRAGQGPRTRWVRLGGRRVCTRSIGSPEGPARSDFRRARPVPSVSARSTGCWRVRAMPAWEGRRVPPGYLRSTGCQRGPVVAGWRGGQAPQGSSRSAHCRRAATTERVRWRRWLRRTTVRWGHRSTSSCCPSNRLRWWHCRRRPEWPGRRRSRS